MISLGNISWQAKHYVPILVALCIGILVLLIWRFLWQKKTAYALSAFNYRFLHHFSLTKKAIKLVIMSIGLLSLILALARPAWDSNEQTIIQEGRDVVIALDISRSMLAQDVKPNRLEHAKQKIKQLVQALNSDRIGLIIFSGSAFWLCPLTNDYDAFFMFLDSIDVESLSSGTTDICSAIEKTLEHYTQVQAKKEKLLIIFTDGEDFSGDITDMKQKVKEAGLSIFTVGVGTWQGAPIPLIDEQGNAQGHQKDEQGTIVISRLNQQLLQDIAYQSGGKYIQTTTDTSDIKSVIGYVEKFAKNIFEEKKIAVLQERYYYPAFIALLCFIVEWVL